MKVFNSIADNWNNFIVPFVIVTVIIFISPFLIYFIGNSYVINFLFDFTNCSEKCVPAITGFGTLIYGVLIAVLISTIFYKITLSPINDRINYEVNKLYEEVYKSNKNSKNIISILEHRCTSTNRCGELHNILKKMNNNIKIITDIDKYSRSILIPKHRNAIEYNAILIKKFILYAEKYDLCSCKSEYKKLEKSTKNLQKDLHYSRLKKIIE